MKNQWTRCSCVLHWNRIFHVAPTEGTHLCMAVQAKQVRCTTATIEEQTQKSETEAVPQSMNCLLLTQVRLLWGKVNRKPHALIQMFSRAFTLDQGWKDLCRGSRGVWESMSAFWQWRYLSHWWKSKIQLAMVTTTPPLFDLEIASSKLEGWNGRTRTCIILWGNSSILSIDANGTLGISNAWNPCQYPTKQVERSYFKKLTWNS